MFVCTLTTDIRCPYCGAAAGEPCETPSGQVTKVDHKPRRDYVRAFPYTFDR